MQDGTGDFTTIQPAVNSASLGDTILVGPGEYRDYGPYTSPDGSWTISTCVGVGVDSLTIIGTNRDGVRIGPPPAPPSPSQPDGVAPAPGVSFIRIESLTIENAWDGFNVKGGAVATLCTFRENRVGIIYTGDSGIRVFECLFDNNSDGFNSYQAASGISIANCEARLGSVGFYLGSATGVQISSCEVRDCGAGIGVSSSTDIFVYNCTIANCVCGVEIHDYSNVTISDSDISGSGCALYSGFASVQASGNIFRGASLRTLTLANASGSFHGNHILKGSQFSVYMYYTTPQPIHVDMRNNYWGTTSADSVRAWIWDHSDDPSVYGVVDFEPFSPTPLPTEKKSLGGVKGLYK